MKLANPLEWRIAARYLRARSDNGFLSFIAVVGVLGVAIGVAVLLVVLGVMNGFERELKDRILAVAAHATISGLDGPLQDWQALATRVAAEPGVHAVAPYVEERALLAHGDAWCIEDTDYQQFRRMVRSPAWQAQVLRERIRNLPGPAPGGVSRAREPRRTES